jgi:hypothetical protein
MSSEDQQFSGRRPALTNSEWNAKLVLDEVLKHGNYAVFPGFKLSNVIYTHEIRNEVMEQGLRGEKRSRNWRRTPRWCLL